MGFSGDVMAWNKKLLFVLFVICILEIKWAFDYHLPKKMCCQILEKKREWENMTMNLIAFLTGCT